MNIAKQLLNSSPINPPPQLLLNLARSTPFLQLTPLEIHPQTQLFINFDKNCTSLHFLTCAARFLLPYQAQQYSTPDILRKVLFAHSNQKISDLDLFSYAFILILGSTSRQADEIDSNPLQTEIFSPKNSFYNSRETIQNSLEMTIKVFKTEIGEKRRSGIYAQIYKICEIIELVNLIQKMELNQSEEMQFENLALKSIDLSSQIFDEIQQGVEGKGVEIGDIWSNKLQDIDEAGYLAWLKEVEAASSKCGEKLEIEDLENFSTPKINEHMQINQILAAIAALPILKLTNYIEQIRILNDQINKNKLEMRREIQNQKLKMKEMQENNNTFFIQSNIVQNGKIYKQFTDLTEIEQNEVKYRATSNLYKYICMKKQLGMKQFQRLFQNDDNESIDMISQDDLLIAQNELKRAQIEQIMQNTVRNDQILETSRDTANSFALLTKTSQVQLAGNTISLISRPNQGQNLVKQPIIKTTKKEQSLLQLDISSYYHSIQETIFYAMNQSFCSQNKIRNCISVILLCRASFATQFFGISNYDEIFQSIQDQYKKVDYDNFNGNINSMTNSVSQTFMQKEKLNSDTVVLQDSNGQLQHIKDVPIVETNSYLPSMTQKPNNQLLNSINFDVPKSLSDMKLICDTTLTGQLHVIFMQYLRWLSNKNKVQEREKEIAKLEKSVRMEKQVVQLRLFTNFIGNLFLRGGDNIGYIVYIVNFTEVLQEIVINPTTVLSFEDDELGLLIIALWAFPFFDDYFQIVKVCLKRALNSNPVILKVVKHIIKDLYIYCQTEGEDKELGRLLFEGQ